MSTNATEGGQETGAPAGEPEEPAPADADMPTPDTTPPDATPPDACGPGTGAPPGDPGDEDLDADGGFPGERPKLSKLAILALVAGILPAVPVAVAAGLAALAGIRRSGRRGHGMAMTALFLAAAWVIVAGAVGTVAVLTHGFKNPLKTVYHEAAVFRLRTGQCIDLPNGSSPTVVSCTVPHDAEVFGTFTLAGSAWPGTAAVQQEASAGCGTRLTRYLNPQLTVSLAQAYVYPGRVDWNAGTRTVICEVRATSGQLTQSVRGSPSPSPSAGG